MADNKDLGKARVAKKDEFYTDYQTILEEIEYYHSFDPSVFAAKRVFCPCDNPEWSMFPAFFIQHFNYLKLDKLTSTSIAENGEKYGRKLEVSKVNDTVEFLWSFLNNDGDFSKQDDYLKDADFVITNPPFSLFRDFIDWLGKNKNIKYSILGNINAITYNNVFPLIKSKQMWIGSSIVGGDRRFLVPDDYPLESYGFEVIGGKKYIYVKGVIWFTNIDSCPNPNLREHQDLLKAIRNSKDKLFSERGLVKLANYDNVANVNNSNDIPANYSGVMAVPVSFLLRYDRDSFEILGTDTNKGCPRELKTKKVYPPQMLITKNGLKETNRLNTEYSSKIEVHYPKEGNITVDGKYYTTLFKRVFIRNLFPIYPKI